MASKKVQKLIEQIGKLRSQDVDKVASYVEGLLSIDHELLDLKEEQAAEICGYNPTSHIDDWEWEAMLRRKNMSDEKEAK